MESTVFPIIDIRCYVDDCLKVTRRRWHPVCYARLLFPRLWKLWVLKTLLLLWLLLLEMRENAANATALTTPMPGSATGVVPRYLLLLTLPPYLLSLTLLSYLLLLTLLRVAYLLLPTHFHGFPSLFSVTWHRLGPIPLVLFTPLSFIHATFNFVSVVSYFFLYALCSLISHPPSFVLPSSFCSPALLPRLSHPPSSLLSSFFCSCHIMPIFFLTLHSISKPAPTGAPMTCSRCGATNNLYAAFCSSCGVSVSAPSREVNITADGYSMTHLNPYLR